MQYLGVLGAIGSLFGGGKKKQVESPHYRALSDIRAARIADQQSLDALQQLADAQAEEERKRRLLQGGSDNGT